MKITMTEKLVVGGAVIVDDDDIGFAHPSIPLTRLQLATELQKKPMYYNFKEMIRGVRTANTLEPAHKSYIEQMLLDQLDTELVAAYSVA